jgi:Rho guanine nucleotide exchange factor 4
LLKDLAKHTWPEHVDYENLQKALNAMENVAEYINERAKESDGINKMAELEKRFTNKKEVTSAKNS